jgi:hypothetical protein
MGIRGTESFFLLPSHTLKLGIAVHYSPQSFCACKTEGQGSFGDSVIGPTTTLSLGGAKFLPTIARCYNLEPKEQFICTLCAFASASSEPQKLEQNCGPTYIRYSGNVITSLIPGFTAALARGAREIRTPNSLYQRKGRTFSHKVASTLYLYQLRKCGLYIRGLGIWTM